jgi:hypothetical protein
VQSSMAAYGRNRRAVEEFRKTADHG